MAFLNRSQFVPVIFGLLVLAFGVIGSSHAETLIYSNTDLTGFNLLWDDHYGETIIDYGTCEGGKITKFTIGYETTLSNPSPGNMITRFYKNTNSDKR